MNKRIRLTCSLGLLLCCLNLAAQRHAPCGGNPVPLSNTCADACLVCDLNGVSARTTNTVQGQSPPGYCTMVVHSMQWLAFVAGSASLTINVRVSACNQNNGVEMGIYASDDCQTFRLVSNCNTNMFNNQTWPFTTTEPLKPGCIYYLVFDGNGPNSCQVDFTVVSGSTIAPTPNTNNKIAGKQRVCVGESVDYSIPDIFGACDYEWRVENGSILNALGNRATVLWDNPGMGRICVKGTNACKDGNEVCLDVEIGEESPLTELGPFFVCFGESYRYKNILLTAGTWQFNDKNKYGCDSNTIIYVENLDLLQTDIDTFLCFPDTLQFGNKKIDTSGRFKSILKSKVAPFCDSTVFLNVFYNTLISKIYKSGDLSCQDTLLRLFSDSSHYDQSSKVKFIWTRSNGDTISILDSCIVNTAGTYFLTLIYTQDSIHICSHTSSILVQGSIKSPDLFLTDSIQFCAGTDIHLSNLPLVDLNNTLALRTFHTSLPCDSSNMIPDTILKLFSDTIIYLKAQIAHCQDVLAIPIKIKPLQHIYVRDQEFCKGSSVDLNQLQFTKDGIFSGGPVFYQCAMKDSSCLVNSSFVLNTDSLIYILPDSATCPEFTSFTLKALRIPDAGFQLSSMNYCLNDSLQLNLNNKFIGENIYFRFQQNEQKWTDSLSNLSLHLVDTGSFTFCIRKEEKNCVDSSCKSFLVHPLPQIPVPECFSTDSSVFFRWNQVARESYTIDTLLGGPFLRLSDTSILFHSLSRGQDIRIRVTAHSLYCGSQFAEINCQSKSCPPVNISVLPVDTICIVPGMNPIKLTAVSDSLISGGQYIWRGKGVTDSLNGTFDPLLAGPGNHRLNVVLDYLGCKYFSSYVVVLRENPLSSFVMDSVICQDSSLTLLFNGSRADSSKFDWDLGDGIFQLFNANKEVRVQWTKPGKRNLRLKLSQYKCLDEFSKEIEVLEHLPPPEITCENTDSFIVFQWKKIKRVKKYKLKLIQGNNGIFLNDTTYQIAKRFLTDSAAIQLSLEDEGPCSEISSSIEFCKSPDCPPRNILTDTVLHQCAHQLQNFSLTAFIQDFIPTYHWSGPAIQLDTVNTLTLNPGTYQFTIHAQQFGCKYTDSILLHITSPPQWGYINVTPIPCDPLKPYGSIVLSHVNSHAGPIFYSINGSAFQQDSGFYNLREGPHLISLKDVFGCTGDSLILLKAPEIPILELGPDLEVLKGDLVALKAMITGNFSAIYWSSPVVLSCQNCEDPGLQAFQNIKLFCTIINEDGCLATDSLNIRIFEQKVFAPNAFSPNGDQINDFFTLFGNLHEIKLLEIYDRWGNRVFFKEHFEGNKPELGWNGRFQNENALPGVYVYRAVVGFEKGADQLLRGDLTIIR